VVRVQQNIQTTDNCECTFEMDGVASSCGQSALTVNGTGRDLMDRAVQERAAVAATAPESTAASHTEAPDTALTEEEEEEASRSRRTTEATRHRQNEARLTEIGFVRGGVTWLDLMDLGPEQQPLIFTWCVKWFRPAVFAGDGFVAKYDGTSPIITMYTCRCEKLFFHSSPLQVFEHIRRQHELAAPASQPDSNSSNNNLLLPLAPAPTPPLPTVWPFFRPLVPPVPLLPSSWQVPQPQHLHSQPFRPQQFATPPPFLSADANRHVQAPFGWPFAEPWTNVPQRAPPSWLPTRPAAVAMTPDSFAKPPEDTARSAEALVAPTDASGHSASSTSEPSSSSGVALMLQSLACHHPTSTGVSPAGVRSSAARASTKRRRADDDRGDAAAEAANSQHLATARPQVATLETQLTAERLSRKRLQAQLQLLADHEGASRQATRRLGQQLRDERARADALQQKVVHLTAARCQRTREHHQFNTRIKAERLRAQLLRCQLRQRATQESTRVRSLHQQMEARDAEHRAHAEQLQAQHDCLLAEERALAQAAQLRYAAERDKEKRIHEEALQQHVQLREVERDRVHALEARVATLTQESAILRALTSAADSAQHRLALLHAEVAPAETVSTPPEVDIDSRKLELAA
jgi:hypothetical protein